MIIILRTLSTIVEINVLALCLYINTQARIKGGGQSSGPVKVSEIGDKIKNYGPFCFLFAR